MSILLGFIVGCVAFIVGAIVGRWTRCHPYWLAPEVAFMRRLREKAMMIRCGHAARYLMPENRPRLTITVSPSLPCRREPLGQFCGMPLEIEIPIDA